MMIRTDYRHASSPTGQGKPTRTGGPCAICGRWVPAVPFREKGRRGGIYSRVPVCRTDCRKP